MDRAFQSSAYVTPSLCSGQALSRFCGLSNVANAGLRKVRATQNADLKALAHRTEYLTGTQFGGMLGQVGSKLCVLVPRDGATKAGKRCRTLAPPATLWRGGEAVLEVDLAKCTGCGQCTEVCPTGALRVEGGHAVVDAGLCRGCEACVPACPQDALAWKEAPVVAVRQEAPAALKADRGGALVRAAPAPWHRRVVPVLASMMRFTGQEVLPRVLEAIATSGDERSARPQAPHVPTVGQRLSGRGRTRQRRRGRHGRG